MVCGWVGGSDGVWVGRGSDGVWVGRGSDGVWVGGGLMVCG